MNTFTFICQKLKGLSQKYQNTKIQTPDGVQQHIQENTNNYLQNQNEILGQYW